MFAVGRPEGPIVRYCFTIQFRLKIFIFAYLQSYYYQNTVFGHASTHSQCVAHGVEYIMTALRTHLVRFLENEWPLTVDDLEMKDQLFIEYLNDDNRVREEKNIFVGWPLYFVPEPASAIALAEEYDVPSILPAAYYDLLRCSPRNRWDSGVDEGRMHLMCNLDKPARWNCLSGEIFRKLYYLLDALAEESRRQFRILEDFSPDIEECPIGELGQCRPTWTLLVKEAKEMH